MSLPSRIAAKCRNVLRGLKQRWGPQSVKRNLWDREYAGGKWDHCQNTAGDPIYELIERYCDGGAILDLGAGFGNAGYELDYSKYSQYVGLDISAVAVEKAMQKCQALGRSRNVYYQGDIIAYEPSQPFKVICFRESIYYIPRVKILATLIRYAQHLAHAGVFVVVIRGKEKYADIVASIEKHFRVLERHAPADDDRIGLVFEPARTT